MGRTSMTRRIHHTATLLGASVIVFAAITCTALEPEVDQTAVEQPAAEPNPEPTAQPTGTPEAKPAKKPKKKPLIEKGITIPIHGYDKRWKHCGSKAKSYNIKRFVVWPVSRSRLYAVTSRITRQAG